MVNYPEKYLEIKLIRVGTNHEKNRNKLRKLLIEYLLDEKPGRGRAELTSKYKYIVEQLSSGEKIYLTRPVVLNKGFDFLIHVENHKFSNGKDNPRHEDITADLYDKKTENPVDYNILLEAITKIYMCHDPAEILETYKTLDFKIGFSVELILKVLKWFFIEQDVRYWNWSGRYMLYSSIKGI